MAIGLLFLAAAGQSPVNAITVHERFSDIVCAGVCADTDLTVRADGMVMLGTRSALRRDGPWKSFKYRVSHQQLRDFWANYARIRPVGVKGPIGTCNADTKTIDLDISWQDSAGRSRLLACFGVEDIHRAYWTGFRILRISPVTGEKLTAEQAETFR